MLQVMELYLVRIYPDGSQFSNNFYVTAANGNDYDDSNIIMDLSATPQI